jgi:hypothetical protein
MACAPRKIEQPLAVSTYPVANRLLHHTLYALLESRLFPKCFVWIH